MIFQFPFPPPPPYAEGDTPSAFLQLFSCIISVLLLFETIVLFLPEKWRWKISQLQFGPHWTAKKGDQ
jgi:hypothetical protein